jgi:hypothetical protein
MAVVAVAGFASAAGAGIAAASVVGGFSLFGFGVLGTMAAAFAIGAGLSMVSRALMPKPSIGQQLTGLDFTVREPDATRKIIYGRTRVGGAIVFIDTTDGDEDNEYIHMVLAFAGHEIDGFEELYANQDRIWNNGVRTPSWQPYFEAYFYNGDQTTANPYLVSWSNKWTADHVLNDTAYVYIRLKYDAEFFSSGLPNFSALIRGKKVYDPRKDSTSSVYDSALGVSTQRLATPSTWQFSQNPALCAYDYLRDTKYGLAEPATNINITELTAAVSLCDEPVALAAGGDQPRYTLDGVLDSGNSKKDNVEAMLSAMSGRLVHSGGEYFISGGAYVAPTVTIDESVMVGSLEVQTKQSRRGLYNGVKGVFRSEEDNYNTADYPAQLSSIFSTEDGDPIYLDMALPFTTNNIRAQRIAKLALLQSRQQTTVTIPCNLTALKFKAGDNVMVSNTKMGWDQKVFQVIGYELSLAGSGEIAVNVQAIETAAAIYDWTSSDEIDYLAGGELALYTGKVANPPVAPLVLTASSSVNDDGTITPTIDVSWSSASDAFTDYYSVEWYNVTSGGAAVNQQTKTTDFTIGPVMPSMDYAVSVYAYNGLGVKSTALSGNVTTVSDTTPNLPSIYQINTDSTVEPTLAQFTAVAGRNPKEGDIVIGTDTTVTPNKTYAWSYNLSSTEWTANSNFISGDLIVDGSITGDQITANSIQVNKLTGDVSELYPVALYFEAPGGRIYQNTTTTYTHFYFPAPDLGISKRNKADLIVRLKYTNETANNQHVRLQIGTQLLASPVDPVLLGSAVAVYKPSSYQQLVYLQGNVIGQCSNSGGFSTNATGSAPYYVSTPSAIWFDASTNRTYIQLANFWDLSTGDDLYFHPYRFATPGTWLAANFETSFSNYITANATTYKRFSISESFGQTTTSTGIRLTSRGYTNTDIITCEIIGMEGTLENVS